MNPNRHNINLDIWRLDQRSAMAMAIKMRAQVKLVAFFFCLTVLFACGRAEADEITITDQEREGLARLSELVGPHARIQGEFMSSDAYLVHWLREKGLNPETAAQALLATLKWRNETAIEDSVGEDFSRFERRHPVDIDGVDREGRPVLIVPMGSWSPRQASLGGQLKKYHRFVTRSLLEVPLQKLEEMYEGTGNENAKNVSQSQFIMIMDLHGVNAREHVCITCILVFSELMTTGEEHYPRLGYRTFFINTPRIFDIVIKVIRPLMSEYTVNRFKVLDHDREKWQAALAEYVDRDQLPVQLGGTRRMVTVIS